MATAAVQHAFQPTLDATQGRDQVQVHERADRDASGAKLDVRTTLNFFKQPADGSAPHPSYIDRPETYKRETEPHEVNIQDIRGDEDSFTLDKQGFQIHRQPATEKDFLDEERIKSSYYAEVEDLLKTVTGASKVFIFDHTIRRLPVGDGRNAQQQPSTNPDEPPVVVRGPVQQVHIDQSYGASLSRVPFHLPDEAEELLKGRVQIINVWRPIRTVERDPLAVAEASSVAEEDLVPVGLIYPHRKGEVLHVRHNPDQRWFYKSRMQPDDVLLIKCFDSKTDGRARRVPHTAFVDQSAAGDAPTRESIEVRTLVFHPDDRE